MSAASAGVLSIWVLSIALLLPGLPLAGPEASRTALLALAWTALAGVPRGGPRDAGVKRPFLVVCALALGPLAVAFTVDLAAGHAPTELALTAGIACVLFLALGVCATRGGVGYRVLWFAFVICAPVLAASVGWGHSAPPHPALAALRDVSPLAWCYDRVSGAAAHPAWPLGASAVLLTLTFLGPGRAGKAS